MHTAILFPVMCLFGQTIAADRTCTAECIANVFQPNSSYIFDMYFTSKSKVDNSVLHSRDLKIFMVVNYINGVSAAFHIDTPYITWANLTSNSILIYDYKREMALLVTDKTKLEGVLGKKTIDIDLLLQRLSKIVQEKAKFSQGPDVFNATHMATEFFRKEYNLQNILKDNKELANKLESNFGLWFQLCQTWIKNQYSSISPNSGFFGFSSVVYGYYQKGTNAVMALLSQAYAIDAMSTALAEGIVKIYTNQADGYLISIIQLIAKLKIYPNAQTAIDSLFDGVPLDISKHVKVVKSAKFSFVVVKSLEHGYTIIIKNLAYRSDNYFDTNNNKTLIIYNKLENIISVHNEILNCTVTVNAELKKYAIYNYFTNYGLVINLNTNKATPFSNSLAAKYLKLSFHFRASAQINKNLQELTEQPINTFDFGAFSEKLNQCKVIENCELQPIVPNGVIPDLKTKFGAYLNLIYKNRNSENILDSMRPAFGTTGVNLDSCLVPLLREILVDGGDIHSTANRFLIFVQGSIQGILSNNTLNIDSVLHI